MAQKNFYIDGALAGKDGKVEIGQDLHVKSGRLIFDEFNSIEIKAGEPATNQVDHGVIFNPTGLLDGHTIVYNAATNTFAPAPLQPVTNYATEAYVDTTIAQQVQSGIDAAVATQQAQADAYLAEQIAIAQADRDAAIAAAQAQYDADLAAAQAQYDADLAAGLADAEATYNANLAAAQATYDANIATLNAAHAAEISSYQTQVASLEAQLAAGAGSDIWGKLPSVWLENETVALSASPTNDIIGASAEMDDSGDTFILGGQSYATQRGSAAIVERVAGVWTTTVRIFGEGVGSVAAGQTLMNLNGALYSANARLGEAVSISGDGNVIAIGTASATDPSDSTAKPAVYILRKINGVWTQSTSDVIFPDPNLVYGSGIGFGPSSVSLNHDGTRVVIGTQTGTVNGQDRAGVVKIFHNEAGVWTDKATLTSVNSPNTYEDYFGGVVKMTGDGNRVAIGAHGWDSYNTYNIYEGAIFIFDWNGTTWTHIQTVTHGLGWASGTGAVDKRLQMKEFSKDGNVLTGYRQVPINGFTQAGEFWLFEWNGSQYVKVLQESMPGGANIPNGSTNNNYHRYGSEQTISADGSMIMVYAIADNNIDGQNSGCWLWEKINGSWTMNPVPFYATSPANSNWGPHCHPVTARNEIVSVSRNNLGYITIHRKY